MGQAFCDLYGYLRGKFAPRNAANAVVRAIYRNQDLGIPETNEPQMRVFLNKVQSIVHSYTKFLSHPPDFVVPTPGETAEQQHSAVRRKQFIDAILKENSWTHKYFQNVKQCSHYGYQPWHWELNPEYRCRLAMVMDSVDDTYAILSPYNDMTLDLYMTTTKMSGKQVFDRWLGGGAPYDTRKDKRRKNDRFPDLRDDPKEEYGILVVWDKDSITAIHQGTQKVIKRTYHNLGKVPCIFVPNFPNPGYAEGISDVAHCLGLNQFVNLIMACMGEIMSYQASPIAVLKGASAADVAKMLEERGIVELPDPQASFEMLGHPAIPKDAYEMHNIANDAIEDQSGMTKLAASGRTDGRRIDTLTAIQGLNVGTEANINIKQKLMTVAFEKFFAIGLEWLDNVYRPEWFGEMAMLSPKNERQVAGPQFSADDIRGEYDVECVFAEGIFDPAARMNYFTTLNEKKIVSRKFVMQKIGIRRVPEMQAEIDREDMEDIAKRAKLAQAENGVAPQGAPQQPMPPEMNGIGAETGMPSPESGQMPPGMPGMPPTGGGMGMPEMSPEAVSPQALNEGSGIDEESLRQRLATLTKLKGEVNLIGVQGSTIILAITNPADKQTVLAQLPEFKGMIQFVPMSGLEDARTA